MTRAPWLAAACIAFALQTPVWAGGGPSPVEQRIRFGTVIGIDDSAATGTYAWKGVPFAKPPIGALRWKAPRSAASRTARPSMRRCR